jgi:glycosyltransferase involved in cell wall biosynthesis
VESRRTPRITVLTAVFNEEESLPLYRKAIEETLFSRTDAQYNVLFVDDGSTDRSWTLMAELCAADARFKAIRLSRNFGAHIAESAGIDHCDGDAVVFLACDLQDPPETIPLFVDEWKAGAEIVWGRRRTREDPAWRKWSSRAFAWVLARYAMPRRSRFVTGGFLLADRKVFMGLRQMPEHTRIIFALVAWTGFRQALVDYDRRARKAGRSGYSLNRMLTMLYDAVLGYSSLPVRLTTFLGIGVFLLSMAIGCYLLANWWTGKPLAGYTSIMLALTFFFGLQFLLLGMIGEYLSRIHTESLRRPLYLIADRSGFQEQQSQR